MNKELARGGIANLPPKYVGETTCTLTARPRFHFYTVQVKTLCSDCGARTSARLMLPPDFTFLRPLRCHACGGENVNYEEASGFNRVETVTPLSEWELAQPDAAIDLNARSVFLGRPSGPPIICRFFYG